MSSCSSAPAQPTPSAPLPVITVNGTAIPEADLANELQYHQNKNFDIVIQQAAQALVIKRLLLTEAAEKGLDTSADNEEEALQKLLADYVSYEDPTNETCERYFESNPGKFVTEPLMEVDHILLAAAKDDLPAREVAKNNAKDIIAQLQKDPMLFPVLAKQFSACPSKETGGSLGQISKGQTVPEFERQLILLPQGLADKGIESRYGVHVVNVARKIEGKPLEYSMVEEKVKGYLIHRASHLAIQAFIQGLVEKAEIDGVKMLFAEENIHI
jgi:peptidyl-prolyl cis-trans isomerase C